MAAPEAAASQRHPAQAPPTSRPRQLRPQHGRKDSSGAAVIDAPAGGAQDATAANKSRLVVPQIHNSSDVSSGDGHATLAGEHPAPGLGAGATWHSATAEGLRGEARGAAAAHSSGRNGPAGGLVIIMGRGRTGASIARATSQATPLDQNPLQLAVRDLLSSLQV